jgi:predicted GH43/DUF377 family glycosyl hydrolase
MKWIKKGLIYGPDGKSTWAKNSALQPTPILINEEIIRVYVGFRDDNGVSRIGFVDLNPENPSEVLKISKKPVLDIGCSGTFDENGVVPCAIIERDNKLYLYYAGYQLGQKVRFYGFSGLAISTDGGKSFKRFSKVPVMDRTDEELLFRAIHSIFYDNGIWKVWYGGGSKFVDGKNKSLPVYDIRYTESDDGLNFKKKGKICINIEGNEHRVGRPYVIKDKNIYKMYYGFGTESTIYRLGYAESRDGINWQRMDEKIGLTVSDSGWDSHMMAYPSLFRYRNSIYLFYNGNNYGYDGFGYAVLEHG